MWILYCSFILDRFSFFPSACSKDQFEPNRTGIKGDKWGEYYRTYGGNWRKSIPTSFKLQSLVCSPRASTIYSYSELQVHAFSCFYTYGPQVYWLRQPRNAFASENHLAAHIWAAAYLAGRPPQRHSAANHQMGCFQNKLTFANDAASSFRHAAE